MCLIPLPTRDLICASNVVGFSAQTGADLRSLLKSEELNCNLRKVLLFHKPVLSQNSPFGFFTNRDFLRRTFFNNTWFIILFWLAKMQKLLVDIHFKNYPSSSGISSSRFMSRSLSIDSLSSFSSSSYESEESSLNSNIMHKVFKKHTHPSPRRPSRKHRPIVRFLLRPFRLYKNRNVQTPKIPEKRNAKLKSAACENWNGFWSLGIV